MRTCTPLLGILIASCCAPGAPGAYKDFYWSDPDPAPPFDPTPRSDWDTNAGWDWSADAWPHMNQTRTIPNGTVISPGASRNFGLEDEFTLDWDSLLWIKFSYAGGSPSNTFRTWGVHPMSGTAGPALYSTEYDDGNGYYIVRVGTYPTPAWEWFTITNIGTSDMRIYNFEMDSMPVPAPGAAVAAAWGIIAVSRRRR